MTKEIRLRACQEKARDAIVDDIITHLQDSDNTKRRFGLIAPTGSGKTLIVSKAIKQVSAQMNDKVAFILLTLEKGELVTQSQSSLKQHLNQTPIGKNIFTIDDTHSVAGTLANSIMIVGWESLNKEDKDGNPISTFMKQGDNQSFPDLCQATRDAGIPIVLIIDEAHAYAFTDKSLVIRNKHINPAYTLEVSATHKCDDWNNHYKVEFRDVVKAGLIKNDIRRITFLTSKDGVRAGANKLKELISLAEQTNVPYNPKMLLFVPNTNQENDERPEIAKLLKDEFSWTEEGGDVVFWMNDWQSKDHLSCKDNLSNAKVIITKQAIDTGIDIPSIQVIVQLRPVGNVRVETQKIGRGLRMPEQQHYKNDLDKLFFYVFNDHELDYAGAEYLKDALERRCSNIKDQFFGAIATFPKLKCSHFERKQPLIEIEDGSFEDAFAPLLEDKIVSHPGFDFATTYFENTREGSLDLDKGDRHTVQDTLSKVELTDEDQVDRFYTGKMKVMLKHVFKHRYLIEDIVGCYWETHSPSSNSSDNHAILKQKFILNNLIVLDRFIFEATQEAEKQYGLAKATVEFDYALTSQYCIGGESTTQYAKHLHDICFNRRESSERSKSKIETSFEDLLEKSPNVVWWQKNYDGQNGMSLSIAYETTSWKKKTFFPDYVIGLVGNKFLVVDTKDGDNDENRGKKQEALANLLQSCSEIDGGLVTREREQHYYLMNKDGKMVPLSDVI